MFYTSGESYMYLINIDHLLFYYKHMLLVTTNSVTAEFILLKVDYKRHLFSNKFLEWS